MAAYRVIPKRARALSFYNLHTGESLKTTYFANGEYIPGALHEINFILRDWRQNEAGLIDPALLDLLAGIHHRLATKAPFQIISGYRTPKTNAMLHFATEGVAVHSLHLDGKAIDICVEGRSLANVRRVLRFRCFLVASATTRGPGSCMSIPAASASGSSFPSAKESAPQQSR